jgi:hypothetical protein
MCTLFYSLIPIHTTQSLADWTRLHEAIRFKSLVHYTMHFFLYKHILQCYNRTRVIYKLQNVQFTWCEHRRRNIQKALLRKVQRSRTDNIQLYRLILKQLSTLYESFYVHKRLGMQAKYTWPHSQQSSLHRHNDHISGKFKAKLSAPINDLYQNYLH